MWPRPRSRWKRVSFYVFALENAKDLKKLFTYNNQNQGYLFRKRDFFNGFQKEKIFIGRGIKYIFHFPLSIKIYFSVYFYCSIHRRTMFQRPASGHLSLQQKSSIIALHQRNVTSVDITQDVGCHRNTVTKWIALPGKLRCFAQSSIRSAPENHSESRRYVSSSSQS